MSPEIQSKDLNADKKIMFEDSARGLALKALLAVSAKQHVQSALSHVLEKSRASRQDKGLCTELVYGTLRYYFRIDAVLNSFLPRLEKLPVQVQMLLRMSVYEILFLEKIPDHATVFSAVEFAKAYYGKKLANVVNAVLRQCACKQTDLLYVNFYSKAHDYYSVPSWLYGYFVKGYDKQTAHLILERSLQKPKIALRVNQLHGMAKDFLNAILQFSGTKLIGDWGVVFEENSPPKEVLGESFNAFHEQGVFSWQAAGSQFVMDKMLHADPRLGQSPLWDACAGQGGKSLYLLENKIPVSMASDIYFPRLRLFRENLQRLGLPLPQVVCSSATDFSFRTPSHEHLPLFYGNILLDVPCSGFGTLSRRPEIKMFRSYDDVQDLIKLQKNILKHCYAFLAPGFFIVYMTCTLNPHENEAQISDLLSSEPSASCVYSWQTPHEHLYLEGMYLAIIQKK